jgi:predicted phosphodiesterase
MDMKYALISDIHGNLPALEAVLADMDGRGDATIYHLGTWAATPHGPTRWSPSSARGG